jgi:hypothetical protein
MNNINFVKSNFHIKFIFFELLLTSFSGYGSMYHYRGVTAYPFYPIFTV